MPRTKTFNEDEMLDKAKDLFWRKGFNGTPPQDILDETGLSRSSLYATYGDKHSLFMKTLQRYRDRETEAVVHHLDQAGDIPLAIRQLFQETYRDCLSPQGRRGCLMINILHELVPHDPKIEALIRENRQATEDGRRFNSCQRTNVIVAGTPIHFLSEIGRKNKLGLAKFL